MKSLLLFLVIATSVISYGQPITIDAHGRPVPAVSIVMDTNLKISTSQRYTDSVDSIISKTLHAEDSFSFVNQKIIITPRNRCCQIKYYIDSIAGDIADTTFGVVKILVMNNGEPMEKILNGFKVQTKNHHSYFTEDAPDFLYYFRNKAIKIEKNKWCMFIPYDMFVHLPQKVIQMNGASHLWLNR